MFGIFFITVGHDSFSVGVFYKIYRDTLIYARVILECSEREKFCDHFRISGRHFGPNFGSPYTFYICTSPSAQDREKTAS